MSSTKKLKRTHAKLKKTSLHSFEPEIEKKIHLSEIHKGSCIELSENYLLASCIKGYRSVLANYPVIEGSYYFEFKIEKANKIEELFRTYPSDLNRIEPHVRIGIANYKFEKEISLGSDVNSYAYKDIDGCVIHEGIKKLYGEKYTEGDVIGCLLHMKPPKPKFLKNDDKETKIEINEGSKLYFFKNGICQGEAYSNLNEGFYSAAISLYLGARARVNFGPNFEKPPQDKDFEELADEIKFYKPYSILVHEPKLYEDIQFP